jgi:hypothetical protein
VRFSSLCFGERCTAGVPPAEACGPAFTGSSEYKHTIDIMLVSFLLAAVPGNDMIAAASQYLDQAAPGAGSPPLAVATRIRVLGQRNSPRMPWGWDPRLSVFLRGE